MSDAGKTPNKKDDEKKTKVKKKETESKRSQALQISEMIAKAICGRISDKVLPKPPVILKVIADDDGGRDIVAITPDNIVQQTTPESIAALAATYIDTNPSVSKAWRTTVGQSVSTNDIKEITGLIAFYADKITDQVVSFAPKDFEGYAYTKFDIDLLEESLKLPPKDRHTPTFNDYATRMTNFEAFRAWVGSLFFVEADRSQYVYIYGPGGAGKGILLDWLNGVLGSAFANGQVTPIVNKDPFFGSEVIGRRVYAFGECDDPRLPNNNLLKDITGSNRIRIREIYKKPVFRAIDVKFIFAANTKPHTSRKTEANRRMIYCELAPFEGPPKPRADVLAALREETLPFLLDCIDAYKNMMFKDGAWGHGPIDSSLDQLNEIADTYDAERIEWADTMLVFAPHLTCTAVELSEAMDHRLELLRGIKPSFVRYYITQRVSYTAVRMNDETVGKGLKKLWKGVRPRKVLRTALKPASFKGDSKEWSQYLDELAGPQVDDGERF